MIRNTKLSARRARVRRVGVVEIAAARCECGKPISPSDLELVGKYRLRAICGACHTNLFQIERTWWEATNDEYGIPEQG
jgi:hypothetical protein